MAGLTRFNGAGVGTFPSMKIFAALVVTALCTVPLSSKATQCLHYEGEPVTLTGQVILQTFYGPPNYGENPDTDSRETQAILVLSKPICVSANPGSYDDEEKDQLKVTLVPPSGVNLGAYAGKKATFQGTLFHANTGHHRTPVLMQVVRIAKPHG